MYFLDFFALQIQTRQVGKLKSISASNGHVNFSLSSKVGSGYCSVQIIYPGLDSKPRCNLHAVLIQSMYC